MSPHLQVLQCGENVGLVTTFLTLDKWIKKLFCVHIQRTMTFVTLEMHGRGIHILVHGPVMLTSLEE